MPWLLDTVLSTKHPRYFTLKFCLICISQYFMLHFLMFLFSNLEVKSIELIIHKPITYIRKIYI